MIRLSLRNRRRRPTLEALEKRDVPATWGIAWPDAQHLSLSFVPDGTSVQGQSSQLFSKLDSTLGAGNWENAILNAFQTWAVNSNINVAQVADGGQASGVAGPAQGDSRFGDVRISAIPLPAGVAAITSPYDPGTGTVAGDMILNSNDDFSSSSGFDLFTVALHEAGHVFGFADSSDPTSFMYNIYNGPQTGLGAGAAAAVQALYGGPRDVVDADGEQVSTDASKPVDLSAVFSGPVASAMGNGDLATAGVANYYKFVVPNYTTASAGLDVQVQTAGLSQLIPRVVVTDSSGAVVGQATATAAGSGVSVHLNYVTPGQAYQVRVDGPSGDVDAIGSYHLALTPTAYYANVTSNFGAATPLAASNNNAAWSQVVGTKQVDYYGFTTPAGLTGGVTVQVQAFGVGLVAPQVAIYNASGVLMGQATATGSGNQTVSLTFARASAGTKYYIQVTNGIVNAYDFGVYQVAVSPAAQGTAAPPAIMQTPWLGSTSAKLSAPNTSFSNAASLATPAGYAKGSIYAAMAGLAGDGTAHYYDVKTPKTPQAGYMSIAVATLGAGSLLPVVSVFDKSGNAVPGRVLAQAGGVCVVQVAYSSSQDYIIRVAASAANGGGTSGNYYMTTTFGAIGSSLATLTGGTMGPAPAGNTATGGTATVAVASGELYEFVLQGDPANSGSDAMLQLTVTDASGNVVATLTCLATEAASVNVLLGVGSYSVKVAAFSPSHQAIAPLAYNVGGTNLTDPIMYRPSGGGSTGTQY